VPLAGEALLAQGAASDASVLQTLRQSKAALDMQLRTVEAGSRAAQQGSPNPSAIPAATSVQVALALGQDGKGGQALQIATTTNNGCVIHTIIAFNSDGVAFPNESAVLPSLAPTASLRMPLLPNKDVETPVNLQVLVGLRPSSTAFHVFETSVKLPRFAAYAFVGANAPPHWRQPTGYVRFNTQERCARMGMWIAQSFVLPSSVKAAVGSDGSFRAFFVSLRDGASVSLEMLPQASGAQVVIRCDDIALAGDLVQGIAAYFALHALAPDVDFPTVRETVGRLAGTVATLSALRQRFSAEMADASHAVKVSVVSE
jgi:Bardet-Biedl syndrome 2 protein